MNKKYEKMSRDLAKEGRFGDDRILHVSQSELDGLGSLLPSGKLPTNPTTGQPEAFLWVPLMIAMAKAGAVGAGIGAVKGAIEAKSKNKPLWQAALEGAASGGVTGAIGGGLFGTLGGAFSGSAGGAGAGTGVGVGSTVPGEVTTETLLQSAGDSAIPVPALDVSVPDLALPDVVGETVKTSIESLPDAVTPSSITESIGSEVVPEVLNEVPSPLSEFTDIATPSISEGFTKEALADAAKEAAKGSFDLKEYYSSPLSLIAPAYVQEALSTAEMDDEYKDTYGSYSGPYDKSWRAGSGVSWAANDGGEVRRRSGSREKDDESYDSLLANRIARLASLANRVSNPTVSGRYNPLSDERVQFKIRPSVKPGGMHRVGVTLPFNQGGLASLRRS